jgi:hypothetical protein
MPKTVNKKYKHVAVVNKYHPREISRDLRTAINAQLSENEAPNFKGKLTATWTSISGENESRASSTLEKNQNSLEYQRNSTPIKDHAVEHFCMNISPVSPAKEDCNKTFTVCNLIEESSEHSNEDHISLLACVPSVNVDLSDFRKLLTQKK